MWPLRRKKCGNWILSEHSRWSFTQIAMPRTSKTTLNNLGECRHPCFVPDLTANAFSFSPLRIMSEKQILCLNTYIWGLEKWCWRFYPQGKNGDADTEIRHGDTVGEEVGGTNWENITDIYTHHVCGRERGAALQRCDDSEGQDEWGRGKLNREGTYTCIIMRDSHCCVAETYTTMETSYLPIKT